jgi:hypothetical protein
VPVLASKALLADCVAEEATAADAVMGSSLHGMQEFCSVLGQVAVPLQVSMVQPSPSSVQDAPDAATTSVGQAMLLPLQVSAKSQPPATAERHTVPAASLPSAGQVVTDPLQVSTASQLSAAPRHT